MLHRVNRWLKVFFAFAFWRLPIARRDVPSRIHRRLRGSQFGYSINIRLYLDFCLCWLIETSLLSEHLPSVQVQNDGTRRTIRTDSAIEFGWSDNLCHSPVNQGTSHRRYEDPIDATGDIYTVENVTQKMDETLIIWMTKLIVLRWELLATTSQINAMTDEKLLMRNWRQWKIIENKQNILTFSGNIFSRKKHERTNQTKLVSSNWAHEYEQLIQRTIWYLKIISIMISRWNTGYHSDRNRFCSVVQTH